MLNRRLLRIKALQNIYSWHLTMNKEDLLSSQKKLMKSIDEVYEMYIKMLSLIVDVTEYVEIDAVERVNKHLPTKEDLNPNKKLFFNKFANLLKQNPEYIAEVKKYKVNWFADSDMLKSVFNKLKESKEYEAYLADDTAETLESSKEIIKFIFRKILLKSPNVLQTFEDKFMNWTIDREVMQGMIAKTLKNFIEEDPLKNKLIPISADWAQDSVFVKDLFSYTLKNDDKYQELIAERTKNWESDRIALMDTVLMKMAICEMIHFPSIPVKVTINEYLELSKDYSTPKSNLFINGILDKVLNDLTKINDIKKTGRGLIEE